VTPYCPCHDLDLFAFFLAFEDFLNCLEYQSVGPFHCSVGLRVIYRCESNLRSNLLIEILEHYTVKILGIVNCDVSRDVIATNDIFPKEFLMVAELTFLTGFASTHFVKNSSATTTKV
jgi:hypothetical protein